MTDLSKEEAEAVLENLKKLGMKDAGDGFTRNKKVICPNLGSNIKLALDKLGYVVRKNEFKGCPEIVGMIKDAPFDGEVNDDIVNWIRHRIDGEFSFMPSTSAFIEEMSNIAFENAYHPVKDYLKEVAPLRDENVKCEMLWIKYGGAEDTELNRAFARLWMTAAVRRIMVPGFKFDTLPILESAQGKNKSLALELLAVKPDWFLDNMPLGADPKIILEETQGVWITEFPEMTGHNADVEKLKAFTSRKRDKARLAYGRFPTTTARQWVGCISKNPGAKLVDAENRRFWPVVIKKFDLDALGRDRDKLWADAVAIEATGASVMLDERLWAAAAEVQKTQRVDCPFAEKLRKVLGYLSPNPGLVTLKQMGDNSHVCVSLDEVWKALELDKVADQNKEKTAMSNAMLRLGFTRKRMFQRNHSVLERGDCYYERGESEAGEPQWLVACF